MATKAKEKKKFQLPHLLFLLLGLLMVMSLLTYVLPAGQFVEVSEGVKEYMPLESRTPVSIWQALLYIYDGIANSSSILALLLIIGGCVEVVLATKALDRVIDGLIYKLRDKGSAVLLPIMFFLMALLGGFGGSDALIAVIPIGVLVAKKLRLDPIVGAGVSFLGTMVGFSTTPIGIYIAQGLMGVPLYSGFGFRMLNLVMCAAIGATYLTIYAKRVEKNPMKSAMGDLAWQADLNDVGELKEAHLSAQDLIITVLFFGQFPVAIALNLGLGLGMAALPAVMIPVAIVIGYINRMNANEIGNSFAKGVASMGFICFIIGLAGAISLVMKNGNILDTIAYYASLPLQNLGAGFASIGISIVVSLLNFFIPSASAKAAALVPIVKPMAETLGIPLQVATQAFQIGDGFCNLISPFLGWTMGGLAIAKVPYQKWVKWVLPLLIILLVFEYVVLFILSGIGWTGV